MHRPYSGSILSKATWLETTFSEQNPVLLVVTRQIHDGGLMHRGCLSRLAHSPLLGGLVTLRQRAFGTEWIQRGCVLAG